MAYAIATALYRHDHCGLVPTSNGAAGRPGVTIRPIAVKYTTSDGATTRIDLTAKEIPTRPRELPYVGAREINATIEIKQDGSTKETETRVPLDVAPLGTAKYPMVIVRDGAVGETQLARLLEKSYFTKHHMAEDKESEVRATMTVLATRIVRGEAAGFETELRQLADTFRPRSTIPAGPISVPMRDGGAITWTPPAKKG